MNVFVLVGSIRKVALEKRRQKAANKVRTGSGGVGRKIRRRS